ncbi:MAG: hypothetical protein QM756_34110 [Polyangiaceae bacterium]
MRWFDSSAGGRHVFTRKFCVAALVLAACRSNRAEEQLGPPAAPALATLSVASSSAPAPVPPAATELLRLPQSAYGTVLAVADDAVYFATQDAAYRLEPGQAPTKTPLALGVGAAVGALDWVFWSEGAIWRAAKRGGKPRRVASLQHQPLYFALAGEQLAWLDRNDEGRFSVQVPASPKPRVLVSSGESIDAMTVLADDVVFVERLPAPRWRFGIVHSRGGEVRYSSEHTGRTPAQLATSRQGVTYYDGNAFELRRFGADLVEQVLAKDVICSPLAAAESAFCASLEGPFEVTRAGGKRPLAAAGGRTITNIAANAGRVAWVRDQGASALSVETVAIGQ